MPQTFKHAVIVAHPAPDSFTLAMARRYIETIEAQGHEAVLRDLYKLGFDPVLKDAEREGEPGADVLQEWAVLGKPDVFVLVYPIWFGTPPAMLTGYIDRVFGAGRSFGGGGKGGTSEMLAGRHLVSLTASGSLRAWLDEKGVLNSLRTVYDRYLSDVFGFGETARYHFDGVAPGMKEWEPRAHLLQVEKAALATIGRLQPEWTPRGHGEPA